MIRNDNLSLDNYFCRLLLHDKSYELKTEIPLVINTRCPYCGDSTKNENKRRGYILQNDKGYIYYYCHNCGISVSFLKYIKECTTLYQEYIDERFKKRYNNRKGVEEFKDRRELVKKKIDKTVLGISLDKTTEGIFLRYAEKREIPNRFWSDIYVTSNIWKFFNLESKNRGRLISSYGLVFPYLDNSYNYSYIQCRFLDSGMKNLRYLTKKFSYSSNDFKIWGLRYIDISRPIYILEGIIDAMFVDNGIAMTGSDTSELGLRVTFKDIDRDNIIFVYDNEFNKNEIIRNKVLNKIDKEYKVVIWDSKIKGKDINEIIIRKETSDINSYLKEHTFKGLRAKIEIGKR
jgi:hypothetical protein